jgi:dolichol-phosphate mannosyltransferase
MQKSFIIIPTYNEKENIEKLISEIFDLNIKDLHILIMDDNSPDKTAEIVKNLKQKHTNLHLVVREKKLGLGSAYIAGFKYALNAGADLIFEMDADFSHNPKYLPEFITQANNNYDVIIGSRRIKGGKIIGWNWSRKFMSSGAMLFSKIILNLKTNDVTAGYRCYKAKVLQSINLDKIKSNGYAFQEEMIYLCEKKGFKIKEIPITFIDRKFGQSKLNKKDIIEFFKTIMKLKFTKND